MFGPVDSRIQYFQYIVTKAEHAVPVVTALTRGQVILINIFTVGTIGVAVLSHGGGQLEYFREEEAFVMEGLKMPTEPMELSRQLRELLLVGRQQGVRGFALILAQHEHYYYSTTRVIYCSLMIVNIIRRTQSTNTHKPFSSHTM
jgi:hypothetical protein